MSSGRFSLIPMSTLISLAALLIAAASFWHSALRPAKVVLDYMPESTRTGGGGINGFPVVTEVRFDMSLVNLGARAGLLKTIAIENVRSSGAPDFATGASAVPYLPQPHNRPSIEIDGQSERFPQTVEAGDVRSVFVQLKLTGGFGLEGSSYLHAEDQERDFKAAAEMLARLDEVTFDVVCCYRRGGGLLGRSDDEAKTQVALDGERFKTAAAQYWRNDGGRESLANLVEGREPSEPSESS